MDPKFKHFVITFFNLQLWTKDKKQRATHTDDWLEKRFNLFEQYCLPSFEVQTSRNFVWLCLFDAETPVSYKKKIEEYQSRFPLFHPCFFTAEEARTFFLKEEEKRACFIRSKISSMLDEDDQYVITTNIDNDDAIHCSMVEAIQHYFLEHPVKERTLYSLNWGLQYFVRQKMVLKMKYPHNHFLTLIEPATVNIHTIEFYEHAGARKCLPTVDIFKRPYWMEIVHENNVNNELRITSRIRYSFFWHACSLSGFGSSIDFSNVRNIYNNLVVFPLYFIPTAIQKLYRKIIRSMDKR